MNAASSLQVPYGFQGARFDRETGLYYFRNRYYNPRTGRFLQRDPAHDPINTGNRYTFVGNAPYSRLDPLGLQSEPEELQNTPATEVESHPTLDIEMSGPGSELLPPFPQPPQPGLVPVSMYQAWHPDLGLIFHGTWLNPQSNAAQTTQRAEGARAELK